MSSSDRRSFLCLMGLLPLAACGFEPAYGPGGPAAGLLGQVSIETPGDKDEFDLVARLEERLGRPQNPAFRLAYAVSTTIEGQAFDTDNAINRYQIIGTADFTVYAAASGEKVTAGRVSSFTAYSAFGTSVETAASRRDAQTRLMKILADQIVTRLIATAGTWNPA